MDSLPSSSQPQFSSRVLNGASSLFSTWPKSVQIAVGLLVTASIFFMAGRWSSQASSSHAVVGDALDRAGPCLDLNRATKSELRLLPGVGESLARRVVDHRKRNGPFHSVDQLGDVSGIGPKTLDRLRPWLFVSLDGPPGTGDDELMPPPARGPPRAVVAGNKKAETITALIDINHGGPDELRKLPGIGPKLSQRIIEVRANGLFKSVGDLRRVPGIGPKTLEKLRPFIFVEEPRMVSAVEN